MLQRLLLITLTLCSLTASAQWQQTGSKVRYVNGLGIPTKDTAAGVSADSSQIVIRPADSSLYVKYKRTWLRVGGGAGGGSIGGSGTMNYVPKFTAASIIGNSQIFDNGTSVGINTTSPSYKLHTIGTGYFSGNLSSAAQLRLEQSAGGSIVVGSRSAGTDFQLYNTGNVFRIYDGTRDALNVNTNGDVGIGTASPAAKLSVQGTTLINTNTDNGVDKLQVSGSGTFIQSLNGSQRFLLTNTNTGTSAESYILVGSTGNRYIGLLQHGVNQSGTTAGLSNASLSELQAGGDNSAFLINQGSATAPIVFATQYSAERMRITSAGNVLIGTTTDNGVDKLQVSGSATVSTDATIKRYLDVGTAATNVNAYLRVLDGSVITKVQSVGATNVGYLGTESNHDINFITNNTIRATISAAGAATFNSTVTASGTLTAATLVKSGGTSSQALIANGSVLTLSSGTYTPTITNNNGTSGLTLYAATYQRIGNIVTVYFLVSGTCTASLVNAFNMTIPFGNVFTNIQQVQGTGFSGTNSLSAYITALNGNTIATVNFSVPASVTTFDMKGSFQYQVQ
jgi:hypothetical protein